MRKGLHDYLSFLTIIQNNKMNKLFIVLNKIIKHILSKILGKKYKKEMTEQIMQFIKFGIVGLSNTVISYAIYVIALLGFQRAKLFGHIDYLVAQVIAFILSVLWSFYWNRKFVFEADNENVPILKALVKTYISYAFTGLFLNSVLSILWVDIIGMSKLIAPIINLIVSVPLNFILNKFWAFKKKG
ncbi:GtrA family protein [Lachnospiraceae bacterium HCP1S3_C3]